MKRLEDERIAREQAAAEEAKRKLAEEQKKESERKLAAEQKKKAEEEKKRAQKTAEPKTYPDDVMKLVEDARFYGEAGQDDQVVKSFHDAFVKGYALTEDDMALFEVAFRRHNDFLKREIARLESEEYRKDQNFRSIKGYKNEQRQLLDWYREVKGK